MEEIHSFFVFFPFVPPREIKELVFFSGIFGNLLGVYGILSGVPGFFPQFSKFA